MRILHVSDHYPPVLGGIETHVAALAEHQASRGDDVWVLTSSPARADGTVHRPGPVTVVRVPSSTGSAGSAGLDLGSFDVVHAHVSVVAPFTSPIAARAARRGVPTVLTVHSMWNRMGPVPALAAAVSGLRSAPVRWTAVSRIAATHVGRTLPSGTPVSVLPNAVDIPARTSTPAAGARPVRIISTMRLARRKRPLALLDIFERARRGLEGEVTLTIVGGGPQRIAVERKIARLGLGASVTLTDRVAPAEVARLLREADVYVAPATLESFGLAALEARCVGLPVVGFATTGLADFVTSGTHGLLAVSDGDMVSQLRRLVCDADLRERIADHNRSHPAAFTWAASLQAHDVVYAAVVGSGRPAARTRSVGA